MRSSGDPDAALSILGAWCGACYQDKVFDLRGNQSIDILGQ